MGPDGLSPALGDSEAPRRSKTGVSPVEFEDYVQAAGAILAVGASLGAP